MSLDSIEEAVEDIRNGRMVIVVDEEDRENEGDLTMAAEKVTPEAVNFMALHGRGLICLPLTQQRLDELRIPLMVTQNQSVHETAFCVGIEARRNVTTGISAADRAITILTVVDDATTPDDIVQPGHVFPLRARPGGVLERAGQTEAAIDLARIAGLKPAGVICEIMNEDGTMARLPELRRFADRHGLKIVSVVELIKFRHRTEQFVKRIASLPFESDRGTFQLQVYRNELDGRHHLAFVKGDLGGKDPVLVRVHTESLLGDVFLSSDIRAGRELNGALQRIEKEGRGVLVYLRVKGKEGLLLDEIDRPAQRGPKRGAESSAFREYGVGAQILADLGLREIRVLTNHPKRVVGLEGFDLKIVEQIPIEIDRPARVSG